MTCPDPDVLAQEIGGHTDGAGAVLGGGGGVKE